LDANSDGGSGAVGAVDSSGFIMVAISSTNGT
jgi:hypothetical protein